MHDNIKFSISGEFSVSTIMINNPLKKISYGGLCGFKQGTLTLTVIEI